MLLCSADTHQASARSAMPLACNRPRRWPTSEGIREKKGFLRRDPKKPRAVDVRHLPDADAPKTGPKPSRPVTQVEDLPEDIPTPSYIPVVGSIAAGSPILAEENVEDYFPLPAEIVGDGELYMLQVVGESMPRCRRS